MPQLTEAQERIAGGLVGLLVGDALGVPYEFHPPETLPPYDQIEFEPPAGFDRAHRGAPPGTWSDDGAQALCLLASLLDCGGFDAGDFASRLVRWQDDGYMAVDGVVFDIGITTARALQAIRRGAHPLDAGPSDVHDNGNGSLMRVLPLALWHRGPDEELVPWSRSQSRVTHGHLRAQLCCALYCLWARRTLEGNEDPWEAAAASLRSILVNDSEAIEELEWSIRPDDSPVGTGSGYVVDCLRSARLAMQGDSYEAVARAAILLGHDTDTTACVAGGLAGIRFGLAGIPERWRSALRGKELCGPLLKRLLDRFR